MWHKLYPHIACLASCYLNLCARKLSEWWISIGGVLIKITVGIYIGWHERIWVWVRVRECWVFGVYKGLIFSFSGKHNWNFMNKSSSLVARVFKTRYYPHYHFLHSSCGGGASFVWSGIWRAKEVLKKGFRCVMGDGKDIEVLLING